MHRVGYVWADDFQSMALASQTVFEFANQVTGREVYSVENYSLAGGLVRSSGGMLIDTQALQTPGLAQTWMFVGGNHPLTAITPPQVLAFARQACAQSRRTAGVCTGAFILAEAGLLDARRATTHWAFANDMQKRHPAIRVEDDMIYLVDGPVWTCAGMTSSLDLALGMVENDLGRKVAGTVAHLLVMHQRRSGGQSQHSKLLGLAPKTDRIQTVLEYIQLNLARPLSVETLAEVVHLSPRQFTRVFSAETGQSPAKAIERLRLEAARLMLEHSLHPLETVARQTGFRDRAHMREVFMRVFGVTPLAVRREAR
ncbi:MAG: HTH-type transcriptional regulator CdhR [Pseudomonas sp.]|nr:MAG: HTH-type transcriptional regulator CdhR [Pseudomonas sp.]